MIKHSKLIDYIMGKVHIPKNIKEINDDFILHISDTPRAFFRPLRILLNELNPKHIIHTGDLVDNIKLEMYPSKINIYEKGLKELVKILEKSKAEKIYLVMGNHDKLNLVKKITNMCIIIERSSIIKIDNLNIKVSHYPEDMEHNPEKFNLFGHNTSLETKYKGDKLFLNGITGIHLICLKTKRFYTLNYPFGTNDERLNKSNIGL